MKKLFYIVLIVVLVIVAGAYLKSKPAPLPTAEQQPQTSEEMPEDRSDCVCDTECICPAEDPDCDCAQTKSTCSCTQKDGRIITLESVETNNDDIEELNPEQTSGEDETILNE